MSHLKQSDFMLRSSVAKLALTNVLHDDFVGCVGRSSKYADGALVIDVTCCVAGKDRT